jgi:tRNA 2-thiouridine synthesizing protein E
MESDNWTRELAITRATEETLTLSDEHWEIIGFARQFYAEYQYTPIQRLIVKHMQTQHPTFSSLDLQNLFPGGPKQICWISGLPKPKRCV